jgi:hypothetical protein
MTDPQETTENVRSLGSSGGDPDPSIGRDDTQGSDVGGPAGATESTTEQALSGTSTVGAEDDDHSQAIDPS